MLSRHKIGTDIPPCACTTTTIYSILKNENRNEVSILKISL